MWHCVSAITSEPDTLGVPQQRAFAARLCMAPQHADVPSQCVPHVRPSLDTNHLGGAFRPSLHFFWTR